MLRPTFTRMLGVLMAAAMLLALSACGRDDSDPLEGGGEDAAGEEDTGEETDGEEAAGEVTVGSANFPENVLLAEIYAQALEAEGVEVTRQLNIGSREVIYDQIADGGLTVLPEYNGALLSHLNPDSEATATEEINEALAEELPDTLELLDSAEAENKDAITVTRETAEEFGLTTLEDLAPVAGEMVMGGPPEFEERRQGAIGLADEYGIEFAEFRSLDTGGPVTVSALAGGDVDAANLFTTDPALTANDFVVLEDPLEVFTAQNITPLVYADGVDDTVRDTLNSISAALDTETLLELDERVIANNEDAEVVAEEWLAEAGLS
jgi:osmoprotectant transport system substrate-binding protein